MNIKDRFSLAYKSFMFGQYETTFTNENPHWLNFDNHSGLTGIYNNNGVVKMIVDLKAKFASTVEFKIRDINTGEILPLDSDNKVVKMTADLLKNPNPLQTLREWILQHKVYETVYGDAFIYFSVPIGFENRIGVDNISVINNVASQFTKVIPTGKYFDQTDIKDIINRYEFRYRGVLREFDPRTILHRNDININFDNINTSGRSRLLSLKREISNISMSLESRNVISKRRGALGVWTAASKDSAGSLPLLPKQKAKAIKELNKYGTLEHQNQFVVTSVPLNWQKTSMPIKDLGLFEEIEKNAIVISLSLGIPEVLTKLYIQGATFENQKEAVKRMYEQTTIPETMDLAIGLTRMLNLNNFGLELIASFDHVPALQSNRKDEASTDAINSKYLKEQFLAGAITYNEWLNRSGHPSITDENGNILDLGNKRIFELEPEQILIITGKMVTEPVEPQI